MTNFESKINEARSQYDAGQYSEASKLYLKVLPLAENNNDSAIVWAELCWTFYKLESYKQTVEAAENVLNFDPEYSKREDIYRVMGYSHLALGDENEAENYLIKSLEIDNSSEKQQYIFYELGKINFKSQNYQEAEKYFAQVENFFQENYEEYWLSVLFFKGFINYYTRQIDESQAVFELLLKSAKDPIMQSNANYGMAYISFEKKDYLKTINLCENVTKQNPQFYDMESLGFLMAASFFYLGRYDVFKMYYTQMQTSYKDGRYMAELSRFYEQIPKQDDQSEKN